VVLDLRQIWPVWIVVDPVSLVKDGVVLRTVAVLKHERCSMI